jgi:prefoldin subunit 5
VQVEARVQHLRRMQTEGRLHREAGGGLTAPLTSYGSVQRAVKELENFTKPTSNLEEILQDMYHDIERLEHEIEELKTKTVKR